MKVLITGGCGFVGSNVAIFLKKRNFSVSSLDNLSRKGSLFNLKLLKQSKIRKQSRGRQLKQSIAKHKEVKTCKHIKMTSSGRESCSVTECKFWKEI